MIGLKSYQDITTPEELEEEMEEEKNCLSCKNKNCYIVTLPKEKKKDCKEHHENYDWGIVFDCKNHNKYKE